MGIELLAVMKKIETQLKKSLILLIIGLSFFEFSNAQTIRINKSDSILSKSYDEMMDANYQLRYDSLAPKFKYELKQALLNSQNENFDSLSKRIKIVESENKELTFYSWDEKSGGSWHSIKVLAKFITENREAKVIEISGNEGETGEFTDAIIYEIHQLTIDDKIHFLAKG